MVALTRPRRVRRRSIGMEILDAVRERRAPQVAAPERLPVSETWTKHRPETLDDLAKLVTAYLYPGAMDEWLRTLRPDATVGWACRPDDCVTARYVRWRIERWGWGHQVRVTVGPREVRLTTIDGWERRDVALLYALEAFERSLDDIHAERDEPIAAHEARTRLRWAMGVTRPW